jgi:hypothetical protein
MVQPYQVLAIVARLMGYQEPIQWHVAVFLSPLDRAGWDAGSSIGSG